MAPIISYILYLINLIIIYYGLVGGNPTMNTPRLCRGEGESFFKFIFYL